MLLYFHKHMQHSEVFRCQKALPSDLPVGNYAEKKQAGKRLPTCYDLLHKHLRITSSTPSEDDSGTALNHTPRSICRSPYGLRHSPLSPAFLCSPASSGYSCQMRLYYEI